MSELHTLLFDLDDTLYPRDSGVWEAIRERINAFISGGLSLPGEEAHELRSRYLKRYGATLNGLMANHDIDPLDYLRFVHDVPIEKLISPDPVLREMLVHLPQKKVIFTNSYAGHAHRILTRLGVRDLFPVIIDIIALEFHNKPDPVAYPMALRLSGDIDPRGSLLIDDRAVNLSPGADLGMRTVLVGDSSHFDSFQPDLSITDIHQLSAAIREL
jgi:putative hydrolase of the HAD superfamily